MSTHYVTHATTPSDSGDPVHATPFSDYAVHKVQYYYKVYNGLIVVSLAFLFVEGGSTQDIVRYRKFSNLNHIKRIR